MTDRQKQIKRLDKMASEIVRKRAVQRSGGCDRCKKYHDWQGLQCAHFVSRVKFSVRWDLDNMAGLCGGCHMFIDRDPEAKEALFTELLGEQKVLYLKARHKYTGKTDLDLIELYLRQQNEL